MKSINPLPAAREIVDVLAKHEIPVSFIDQVFEEAKKIAEHNSFIRITAAQNGQEPQAGEQAAPAESDPKPAV